jgi:hypothetical protein
MFRAGLLLISRRYYSVYTAICIYHAFMLAGRWQDHKMSHSKINIVSHKCDLSQKATSNCCTLIYSYKLFIPLFKVTNRSEKDSMRAVHSIWKLTARTFEKPDEISSSGQYSADTHNTPFQSTALHNNQQKLVALWVRNCTVLDFLNQTKWYEHCWNQTCRTVTHEQLTGYRPHCTANMFLVPNQGKTNILLSVANSSCPFRRNRGRGINTS